MQWPFRGPCVSIIPAKGSRQYINCWLGPDPEGCGGLHAGMLTLAQSSINAILESGLTYDNPNYRRTARDQAARLCRYRFSSCRDRPWVSRRSSLETLPPMCR